MLGSFTGRNRGDGRLKKELVHIPHFVVETTPDMEAEGISSPFGLPMAIIGQRKKRKYKAV